MPFFDYYRSLYLTVILAPGRFGSPDFLVSHATYSNCWGGIP